MTCHVAMVGPGGAVMASDSQGSTDSSELHGLQKLVAGSDFLVGGTGAGDLIRAVMQRVIADPKAVNAANVNDFIVQSAAELFRPGVMKQVEFVVATEHELYYYQPGRFLAPQIRESIAMAGSGAEFVQRAWFHEMDLGIHRARETLADTFVGVEDFLDAANESLTVDDKLMLGIVSGRRTYLMGHREIYPVYAPQPLVDKWNLVADKYDPMKAMAKQIRADLINTQQNLSSIRIGKLSEQQVDAIRESNAGIEVVRRQLNDALADYITWYDGLLER